MLFCILLVTGIIDLRCRKIPNRIIALLIICATVSSETGNGEKIISFVLIFIPILVISLITDKIKGGDLKFIAVVGMAIGLTRLSEVLVYTVLIAIMYSAITNEKSVPLAFVTFLGYVSVETIRLLS